MEFRQVTKFMLSQVWFFKIGVTSDLGGLAFQEENPLFCVLFCKWSKFDVDFALFRVLCVLVLAGASPAEAYILAALTGCLP